MNNFSKPHKAIEETISEILDHPHKYSFSNELGGSDIVSPDGLGVSYDSKGEIRGVFKHLSRGNFSVKILKDAKLKEPNAVIFFSNQPVANLSQENGFQNMTIDFYPPVARYRWTFKFNELIDVIEEAKLNLL